MGYKYRFEHMSSYPDEQIGFRWLNYFIDSVGLNYVGGYIVYSLIFIVCSFILIRSYGKDSKYMYAFVIPSTLIFISGIIRQGISFSFLLLAIYFLNKRKWAGVVISIVVGVSIHSSILIPFGIILACFFLLKKPIHWLISIPLYIFFAYLFDVSKVGIISNYIQYVSLDSKFQSYIDNSDRWFGADAVDDKFEQSIFALTMSSLYYISIIYLGYHALKIRYKGNIAYLYNSAVIGFIFLRAVFLFEILKRFAQPLVMLHFIPLGYILYIFLDYFGFLRGKLARQRSSVSVSFKPYQKFLLICIFLYLIFFWGRFIFQNPEAMFFWNS